MTEHSYATSFSVEQSPEEAFRAITNVRGWWSEEIDGRTEASGDEFTYRYEDVHRCRIRVTEVLPYQRVSWLVLGNYFDFTADTTEWTGTTMTFEVFDRDGRTDVRFIHRGLVPEYECFDVCSNAWGFYVSTSLRNLIATGEGQPNGRGRPRLPAEQRATARQRELAGSRTVRPTPG